MSVPPGLLPEPGDPNFSSRLAEVPEFAAAAGSTKHEKDEDPCVSRKDSSAVFQVAPHQRFVRSFMSASTPYNGLMLFHGLGTGKTCAAMQVAEETFSTSARIGTPRRTFVVAAPNLQAQFKANLFDADKLVQRTGVWTMPGCVAPELLHEALPDPRTTEPKATIVRRLEQAVARRYVFVGPDQLANMVDKVLNRHKGVQARALRRRLEKRALTEAFGGRLYVIDEAHDLRVSGPGASKKAWRALERIASDAANTKFLMLTATPVFDNATDVVSLFNLLLLNDGKTALRSASFFTSDGALRDEDAPQRLAKAVTGYVSFVSSQDTKAFPFLLLPEQFAYQQPPIPPPTTGLRTDETQNNVRILDLANVSLEAYQLGVLNALLSQLRTSGKGMGHTEIAKLVMALNFAYPGYKPGQGPGPEDFIASKGLLRCLINRSGRGSKRRLSGPYVYEPAFERAYGDIFAMPNLRAYSAKVAKVLEETRNGTGIVLVYSQYLESGAVPLALCLERAGYVRQDGPALWDTTGPAPPASRGGYILITGDNTLSPNNPASIAMARAADNANGEKIKIIVISQAGSQGVDLQNVRQVQLIDPWYNLGRAEQIIGRGRRHCSHVQLPPEERNVSVYMYSTLLANGEEAPDRYVYNLAAGKAIEGGQIMRALKEWSVDCWLSDEGKEVAPELVAQVASNGHKTEVSTAPQPYSFACDYQATCAFRCGGARPGAPVRAMYSDRLIDIAGPPLLAAMRAMFRTRVSFSREEFHDKLGKGENGLGYTPLQIDAALTALVTQPEQWVVNQRGVPGHVQNIDKQYLFVPAGLDHARLSLQDRLSGGIQTPQAVEVEPPDVRLGSVKVYNDASDGAKLAKVILRRAEREAEYVPLPPGQQDIAWGWGAMNAMHDPTRSMRARQILDALKLDPAPEIEPSTEVVYHIVAHEVDIANNEWKLALLRAGAAGKISAAVGAHGEQMLLSALRALGGPYRTSPPLAWTGVFAIGNMSANALEFFMLPGDGTVRRAAPSEIQAFRASRAEVPPLATVYGYIGLHRKQYLTLKVVDARSSAKQAGWQCRQASKGKVLAALNGITGPGQFTDDNTRGIGSSRELCIDLELLLRWFQVRKKDDRSWILTYEQTLLMKGN